MSAGLTKASAAALALAASCIAASPAKAQLLDSYFVNGLPVDPVLRGPEVAQRLRPEYDPQGVRVGGFILHPTALQSVGYDSNVIGVTNGPDSPFLETQAGVTANSDWNRNGLSAGVAVDNVDYTSLNRQSYTNWTAALGGTYDIGHSDQAALNYRHGSLNELPSSIGSSGIFSPLPYTVDYVNGSYAINLGRFTITPQVSFATYQFGSQRLGSVTASGAANNHTQLIGSLTAAYELSPSRDVIFIVRGGGNTYGSVASGTASPNSTGITVLGGLQYTADAVTRYRLLVGYEERTYTSSIYGNQKTPAAEASVIWSPTGLTTVTATAARTIEDSLSGGTIGYTYTLGRLVIDHEYLPNILLKGTTQVQLQQQTVGSGGPETYYGVGFGVTWLLNRNMRLIGNYGFTKADRSAAYTRNLVSLSLGFQL